MNKGRVEIDSSKDIWEMRILKTECVQNQFKVDVKTMIKMKIILLIEEDLWEKNRQVFKISKITSDNHREVIHKENKLIDQANQLNTFLINLGENIDQNIKNFYKLNGVIQKM